MKRNKGKAVVFFVPFMVCFILFWGVPLVYGFYVSLHNMSLTKGNRGFVGLDNYIALFDPGSIYSKEFLRALKNTLIFVVISVPLLVGIALILALIIDALPQRVKGIFRTIFFMSYSISVTAVAAVFLWLFNSNGGYVNNILSRHIYWLEKQPNAWIALTIATVWWTVGYNMMLLINGLNEIDTVLFEAASVDGANYGAKLKYIILPAIKNVTSYVLLTSIIAYFNMYGQSNLITKGGPAQSTETLIMTISDIIMKRNNLGIGSAMAIMMGGVVMAFAFAQNRLNAERKEIQELEQ